MERKSAFIIIFTGLQNSSSMNMFGVWQVFCLILFEHGTVWMQAKRNYMDTSKASI
jgi:hypothetical protein